MGIYKTDKHRTYDIKKHRYSITNEYMISEYGIDLNTMAAIREDINPSTAANRFLNMISADLYRYIYEHVNNRDLTEYLLAGGHPDWPDIIQEALGLYAYAIYLSGNMYSLEYGLSLDGGKELDMKDISIQHIPTAVKECLETAPGNILFRGTRIGYDMEEIRKLKENKEY